MVVSLASRTVCHCYYSYLNAFVRVLASYDIRGMPVVDDAGKVLGLISCKEVGHDALHRDACGQPFSSMRRVFGRTSSGIYIHILVASIQDTIQK